MTTKTIKTILFASLIAVIALPFSMVDYAVAEQTKTTQELLDKYAERYTKLQVKIDNSNDEVKIQKWTQKQLNIIEKVEALITEQTGDETEVQVIIDSQVRNGVSLQSVSSKYFSESGSQTGCDGNSDAWSFYGTIYYDRDYFWMTTCYPSDVSEGSHPNCSDKQWGYNLYTEVENIFSFGGEKCASNFTISNYTSSKFVCPDSTFSYGEVWTIKNSASYTGGSPIIDYTTVWLL